MTLVEVMVALVLLLITMIPLGYLVTNEVQQAATAKNQLAALGVAEKWIEILGSAQDPPPRNGALAVDTGKPLIPVMPDRTPLANNGKETRGGTEFTVRAEYTWTGTQDVNTAPDLCTSGGAQVLNLQVTVTWGKAQQETDTTILDYPPPGIPQYGFYQLQILGDSSANDLQNPPAGGYAWSSRVQAIPVTFTPTGGAPVTTHPDRYGCVFAELIPLTTSLTTALTTGVATGPTLKVNPLPSAVGSGDTIVVGSGGATQTFTTTAASAFGGKTLAVTSQTANATYPVGTSVSDTAAVYTVNVTNPVPGSPVACGTCGNPSFVQNLATDGPPNTPEPTGPFSSTASISPGVVTVAPTLYYDEGSTIGLSYPTSTFTADGVTCPGIDQITCLSQGEGTTGSLGGTPPYATLASTSGSTWSSVATPSSPTSTRIASVACATAACIGVGYGLTTTSTGTTAHGVIIADNTTNGTVTADTILPANLVCPSSTACVASLTNVICPTAMACVAWGTLSTGAPVVLAGTISSTPGSDIWSAVNLPNTTATTMATLNQVACTPDLNCVAVGSATPGQPLDLWGWEASGPLFGSGTSGGTWVPPTVPITGLGNPPNLTQVACPSAGKCMAIGTGQIPTMIQGIPVPGPTIPIVVSALFTPATLATGTIAWTPVLPSVEPSSFSQLVCLPSNTCLAVGTVGTQAIIYSGTAGSISSGTLLLKVDYSVPGTSSSISQVTCPSSSTCVAIGSSTTSGTTVPVILSGAIGSSDTWSLPALPPASPPGIPPEITSVSAVSCPNASTCAVAASNTSGANPAAAILYGTPGTSTTWTSTPIPSVDASALYLTGISCTPTSGTSTCSAVGASPSGAVIMTSVTGPGGTWNDHTADPGLTLTGSPTASIPIELAASGAPGILKTAGSVGFWNAVVGTTKPGKIIPNTTLISAIFPFASGYGVTAADCQAEDSGGLGGALAATVPGTTGVTLTNPATTVPLAVLPIQVNASSGAPESGDVVTLMATTTGCAGDQYTLQPTGPDGLSRTEVPFGKYTLSVTLPGGGSSPVYPTVVVSAGSVTVGTTVYLLPQTPTVVGP
jgi:Tfp pilus assembly protein PilV